MPVISQGYGFFYWKQEEKVRQYIIDELGSDAIKRVSDYLQGHCESSGLNNLFWLQMPEDILSPEQYSHKACQPHCVGIEVGDKFVSFEMLVRSRNSLKCNCIAYATPQQREFILSFADRLAKETGI